LDLHVDARVGVLEGLDQALPVALGEVGGDVDQHAYFAGAATSSTLVVTEAATAARRAHQDHDGCQQAELAPNFAPYRTSHFRVLLGSSRRRGRPGVVIE